ncbi:MAG: permease, partial [Anaerolineae bacterium]|nr:permease [Anaerolineae bacterium]
MDIPGFVARLLQSGAGNLAAYLAAHVLLCLVPAFFIAGALSALVPKEAVTRYLGRSAPKFISYPASAIGGFVLAVCSCTIMPLFAGIYKKGAGLGPAITFLFVGPAINILALAYTGVAIGMDIAIARIVLSIAFGFGIGLIMALIFRKDDASRDAAGPDAFAASAHVPRAAWWLLAMLLFLLIAGTLQVGLLTNTYAQITLPLSGTDALQATLNRLVPFDAARGEEGVTVQGLLLIGLLIAIAGAAWRGLNHVDEGFNRWTTVTLALVAMTLLIAALRLTPATGRLTVAFPGKFFAVGLALSGIWLLARRSFEPEAVQEWLWETWRFVRQIFPLLVVGVFVVGTVRPLIRPEWIEAVAGSNTLVGNVVGVLFGVFMYLSLIHI